jgi:hypothetical protein
VRNTSHGVPVFTVDPQTCTVTGRVEQTIRIEGGTGRFRHAAGTLSGHVRGWSVAPRNPDGTCSQRADALLEADAFSARGTLKF